MFGPVIGPDRIPNYQHSPTHRPSRWLADFDEMVLRDDRDYLGADGDSGDLVTEVVVRPSPRGAGRVALAFVSLCVIGAFGGLNLALPLVSDEFFLVMMLAGLLAFGASLVSFRRNRAT